MSSAILHRTAACPPIAASAKGIYVTLEDGKILVDGVGGAAVACIGNGHPATQQAIKDQTDKMSCEWLPLGRRPAMGSYRAPRRVQYAAYEPARGGARAVHRRRERREL